MRIRLASYGSHDRNSIPVTALQTSDNPWIRNRDVTEDVDTLGLVPSLIPAIPLDRRSDPSGCRWVGESENQGTSSGHSKIDHRSRRKVGCGDGSSDAVTGATDGAVAERNEMKEVRWFSEDENFSYETCLTARSHPSDVKEL